MIYLCSVYSIHAKTDSEFHKALREHRARYAMKRTAQLLSLGVTIFSPIAHCHQMSVINEMPKDFKFWQQYDEAMIDASDGVFVLKMPHWEDSEGITHEINYAKSKGKDVIFLDCLDYEELIQMENPISSRINKANPLAWANKGDSKGMVATYE